MARYIPLERPLHTRTLRNPIRHLCKIIGRPLAQGHETGAHFLIRCCRKIEIESQTSTPQEEKKLEEKKRRAEKRYHIYLSFAFPVY